jgi:DNA-binding IclR family transcriptional regulator
MAQSDPRLDSARYSAPALDKGLDILEALAGSERPQGIADLSRTLNRTPSEIFRMVGTLERRGYIVRDEAGSFRLSLRIYELAHMHSPFEQIIKAAAAPMRQLSDDVRETTVLSALSHGQLIVLAEELSMLRVRLSVEIGSQVPALRTVSGQMLVAHMPLDELQRFLDNDAEYNSMSPAKQKQVRTVLGKLRGSGRHIAPSSFRTGIDISVLIGNPAIGLLASLAIPVLAGGVNEGKEKDLLKAMTACAREINRNLRLEPPPSSGSPD